MSSLNDAYNLQPVAWKSPTNVAVVKQWGQLGLQLPVNPSVSFTLNRCAAITRVDFRLRKRTDAVPFSFLWNGEPEAMMDILLKPFFQYVFERYPILRGYVYDVSSSGECSRQSIRSMTAAIVSSLALCLVQLHHRLQGDEKWPRPDEAGSLARLGYGSACRSMHGGWMIWGRTPYVGLSTDDSAYSINDLVHPSLHALGDTRVLLHNDTPCRVIPVIPHVNDASALTAMRAARACENTQELVDALKQGDFSVFARLCEQEATEMLALMEQTALASASVLELLYVLFAKVQQYRSLTSVPVCYTLDVHACLHLLYPLSHKAQVVKWVDEEFLIDADIASVCHDDIGAGPQPVLVN